MKEIGTVMNAKDSTWLEEQDNCIQYEDLYNYKKLNIQHIIETKENCLKWIYKLINELSADADHIRIMKDDSYDFDEQDLEMAYKLYTYLDKYLHTDFKENEENFMEKEENKPLTWDEILQFLGKPIWDNEAKIWRVLTGYSFSAMDEKSISFADGITAEFEDGIYYPEEVKEED